MSALFRVIITVARLSGFLSLTLLLGPLQFLVLAILPRFGHVIPMLYHRGLIWMLGVTIRRHGAVPPAGALLASNHVSWFDIVAIGAQMPVSFIAKHEVKTWPLFGQLANLQRTIYIKRARGRHTLDNRDTMKERLVAGDRLVLFAEGTTGNGARAQPFKSALFSSVQRVGEAGPDIVVHPLTISYTALGGRVMTQPSATNMPGWGTRLLCRTFFSLWARRLSPWMLCSTMRCRPILCTTARQLRGARRRGRHSIGCADGGEMPQTVCPMRLCPPMQSWTRP